MLVFITGISTSGKSAMAKELSRRGYEAYDLEHDGMSAWYDRQTGVRAAEFGQVPERTKAWMDAHEWRVSIDKVRAIAANVGDKAVFLCGGGANEQEVITLCDAVVWLQTDETTIRQRVVAPRDHTYGTKPHELAAIIEGNQRKEQEYCAAGAAIIDARRPLSTVVNDIISYVESRAAHAATKAVPTYTVELPSYSVASEPNHRMIGRTVDDVLRQYFMGQKVVVRGLSSREHPNVSTSELIEIIKQRGTDRYDVTRAGDRYDNIGGKHIDLFAFRRTVTEKMQLFRYMSWGFYHGSIAIHGAPTRLDILTVYDSSKLKSVLHRYEGRDDYKRDGFMFVDPDCKAEALLAVIHLK